MLKPGGLLKKMFNPKKMLTPTRAVRKPVTETTNVVGKSTEMSKQSRPVSRLAPTTDDDTMTRRVRRGVSSNAS